MASAALIVAGVSPAAAPDAGVVEGNSSGGGGVGGGGVASTANTEKEKEKTLARLAELVGSDPESTRLDAVLVDGLVLLKIIKHAKDHASHIQDDTVAGQLLGLEIGNTLQITDCFPFPARGSDETTEDASGDSDPNAEYQWEMMRCLREVNADNNIVGYYQTTYLGSFLSQLFVETQYTYQSTLARSVALVYDPLRTKQGSVQLRAFRLTQPFMDLFKNGAASFTQDAVNRSGLSFRDIVEEIPVFLRNSSMASAYLLEMEESMRLSASAERLDLAAAPFLEKNLEFLIEYLDDLSQEQNRLHYYQRNLHRQEQHRNVWMQKRRDNTVETAAEPHSAAKAPPAPSRLDSLLITKQINSYCEQINSFAGDSFGKLFMVAGLHQPPPTSPAAAAGAAGAAGSSAASATGPKRP